MIGPSFGRFNGDGFLYVVLLGVDEYQAGFRRLVGCGWEELAALALGFWLGGSKSCLVEIFRDGFA